MARFFDHADEYIFEGKRLFACADDLDSIAFKLRRRGSFARLNIFICDHMEPVAEQRNSPTLCVAFEEVGGMLRLVDDEFKQMAGLRAFDAAGSSLCRQSPASHESQAVTLFRLFEVMRSHEN